MEFKKAWRKPRFFIGCVILSCRSEAAAKKDDAPADATQCCIGVSARECYMAGMFLDQHQSALRIVIDDHSRLPGRFFGRFTASITAGLIRAI
jgi:hypothetical protein